MRHDLDALYSCVEEDSDTNQMVDNFSEKISHVFGKYCTSEKEVKKHLQTLQLTRKNHGSTKKLKTYILDI